MIIPNKKLLARFAEPGKCEWCGQSCTKREGHHHRSVGAVGHVDIAINLISLGNSLTWQCDCHSQIHAGKYSKQQVLERIAAREKVRPEDITTVMDWMIRLIKPSRTQLVDRLEELSGGAKLLAIRELMESGKI